MVIPRIYHMQLDSAANRTSFTTAPARLDRLKQLGQRPEPRADDIETALLGRGGHAGDSEELVTEAITDLQHLCDRHGLDFLKLLNDADKEYKEHCNQVKKESGSRAVGDVKLAGCRATPSTAAYLACSPSYRTTHIKTVERSDTCDRHESEAAARRALGHYLSQ